MLRSIDMQYFLKIICLCSVIKEIHTHFCRVGWCLETPYLQSSNHGDVCRLCSRIDNPQYRRGKLDVDGPWNCPVRCAANPHGFPLCGTIEDMKVPCKISNEKHKKHSKPFSPPSRNSWKEQELMEQPYAKTIANRQKGRHRSKNMKLKDQNNFENQYELNSPMYDAFEKIYGINKNQNDDTAKSDTIERNNKKLKPIVDNGEVVGSNFLLSKNSSNSRVLSSSSSAYPFKRYHQNENHNLKNHQAKLLHEKIFMKKSCSESDILMKMESKKMECSQWNENERLAKMSKLQNRPDLGYRDINLITDLNLTSLHLAVCVIGSSQALLSSSQYREHFSAMFRSLKTQVLNTKGTLDFFVHVDQAEYPSKVVSSSIQFLEPISCQLHDSYGLPPNCLKAGYSDFVRMRACMSEIEEHEQTKRKNIPYQHVLHIKPGFYSEVALPSLEQWFHLRKDIVWTAVGPKKPRPLLRQFDDPVDNAFALLPRDNARGYLTEIADTMESCLPMNAGETSPKVFHFKEVEEETNKNKQINRNKKKQFFNKLNNHVISTNEGEDDINSISKTNILQSSRKSWSERSITQREKTHHFDIGQEEEQDNDVENDQIKLKKLMKRRRGKIGQVGSVGRLNGRTLLSVNNNNNNSNTELSMKGVHHTTDNEKMMNAFERKQHHPKHQDRVENASSCFKRWRLPECRVEQALRKMSNGHLKIAAFPFAKFGFLCDSFFNPTSSSTSTSTSTTSSTRNGNQIDKSDTSTPTVRMKSEVEFNKEEKEFLKQKEQEKQMKLKQILNQDDMLCRGLLNDPSSSSSTVAISKFTNTLTPLSSLFPLLYQSKQGEIRRNNNAIIPQSDKSDHANFLMTLLPQCLPIAQFSRLAYPP